MSLVQFLLKVGDFILQQPYKAMRAKYFNLKGYIYFHLGVVQFVFFKLYANSQ
jgi:hypothetical protein